MGPPFLSDEDVITYVEAQLAQGVPQGWRVIKSTEPLRWIILPDPHDANRDYMLQVSADRTLFIIYWGNSDAGSFSISHAVYRACILDLYGLRNFSLADALRYVFEMYRPNLWGLT